MLCVSVKKAGLGIEKSYRCKICAAEITIPAEGFIGTYLFVWVAVSAFLAWMFLFYARYPGVLSYLFVSGFILLGGFFAFRDLFRHRAHPVLDVETRNNNIADPDQIEATGATKFWDLGLLATPLVTVAGIAIVLGVAAFLGYLFSDY